MKLRFGAAGGDRTHDPWLRRPILYPLSYSRNLEPKPRIIARTLGLNQLLSSLVLRKAPCVTGIRKECAGYDAQFRSPAQQTAVQARLLSRVGGSLKKEICRYRCQARRNTALAMAPKMALYSLPPKSATRETGGQSANLTCLLQRPGGTPALPALFRMTTPPRTYN